MQPGARRFAALLALIACWGGTVRAQEIEPRAYSPSPVGVNFLISALGRSSGAVLTDPSLPVSNIEAGINALAVGYGRTFGLAGRSANVGFALPYVSAHATGDVGETRRSVTREGVGDARLRLAVNLLNAPAMTPREFAQREPKTTLGLSLTVNIPNGQYDSSKLVNIGTHRWAAKTEFGISQPYRKWFFEAYGGVWWFADNDNFFGGHRREQAPIAGIQTHVSYTFRPRLWLAFDATFYNGGQTTVDGVENADRQANSRAGLTLSTPLGQKYSLKFSASRGATTRIGNNFTSFGIGLQYAWLDRPAHP